MAQERQTFIFGPVPSRRLGRSLGVDVVPFKTCTYNCIYCQLGRTTHLTIARKQYVPMADVMEQLWRKLKEGLDPDYITLSGSGEPTLHSDLGILIDSIKERTEIPVAVLTNGSLLWKAEVQESLKNADLVIPSLDAGSPAVFRQINRPHPKLLFEQMVRGLIQFRRAYTGQIWLEVFLLNGVNSSIPEVLRIKKWAEAIRPDKIQLNTAVRPTAEDYARRVPEAGMRRIQRLLGECAEVVIPYEKAPLTHKGKIISDEILVMLRRRPCTLTDIVRGLRVHRNEAIKYLVKLEEGKRVQKVKKNGTIYYQALTILSDHEP